jgi:hypothetical protein
MNDDITRLLHDAVDDLDPRREPGDATARLDPGPGGRGSRVAWIRGAAAAAAAVVLVTGGAAYLHSRSGTGIVPATGRTVDSTVYFVGVTGLGPRLFSENHESTGVTVSDVQAAVDAALSTPTDPDYRSAFAPGTQATVTDGSDGTVEVDFTSGAALAAGMHAATALQSLVWTVDAAVHRPAPVRFTIGGQVPTTLFGVLAEQSYSAAAADDILSPVSVDLEEGAQVTSGTTIRGKAAAVEANVVWTLKQGNVVVRHGFATANECCTLSPFAFTLEAPPGAYTLTVSDTDPSDGEGNGITSDTKTIQVD